MKRLLFFLTPLLLLCLALPKSAFALAPDQYALQVIQKDLPQTVRWFGMLAEAPNKTQAEVYSLYQSALPENQANHQQGISVKGSLDRMLLLLEGARYFPQVQTAPLEFQNKKEMSLRVLQAGKDQLDRTQFGEDPQVLLEEWIGAGAGIGNITKFAADMIEVFTDLQKLLSQPAMTPVEASVDAEAQTEVVVTETVMDGAEETTTTSQAVVPEDSFERQRFSSYVQTVEAGTVAEECLGAKLWKTDRAESCQNDDSIECDRSYARQCKKLQ